MDGVSHQYLYNNKTEKVSTKKIVPKRQIIIKKKGTKMNNIFKEIKNIKKDNPVLYKSAILNKVNHNYNTFLEDSNNLSNFINESEANINYNKTLSKTIIKPVIYQQSFLKPIILPVNIKYLSNLNQSYMKPIPLYNYQTIDVSDKTKNKKVNKIRHQIDCIEKMNINKENINQNTIENNAKRKVIIQKSIKFKNKFINQEKVNEKKKLLLNHPLQREQDTLFIKKLNKFNSPRKLFEQRLKYNTFQQKAPKDNILNNYSKDESNNGDKRNNDIFKSQKLKMEEKSKTNIYKENVLDESIQTLEKINNLTINNTLKKKYDDMIKNKMIKVGLNKHISNTNHFEPRDSIRFKENSSK